MLFNNLIANINGLALTMNMNRRTDWPYRGSFFFLSLLLLLVSHIAAFAQESEEIPIRVGAIGWGTMNLHRGDFTSYDGVLECGTFDEAQTIGWGAGYLADLPLGSQFFFSGRLYYWKGDGDFVTPNPTPTRISVDEQTVVPLETEHTLETALDYVMADLLMGLRLGSTFRIAVGPSIGYAARASYEQEERIISPEGITFLNGASTRNIIAGNFDEQGTLDTRRALRIAATAALIADIPLSERLNLSPEIGFSYGLTSVLSSFDWNVHAVRAGASLSYALGGTSEPDTILIDPPDVPQPQPMVAFETFNRQNGVQLNYAEITIAEEGGSDLTPLLPYLFFDPNSSVLPSRYRRLPAASVGSFDEERLNDSTLGVYHDLLNIVGSRMRKYPESTIAITGTREPLDDTGSTDKLSEDRAATVRNYLTSVWGIAPGRIALSARTLPQEVSNRSNADGRQENRRVEIGSNDSRVLAPVVRRIGGTELRPDAIVVDPSIQFGERIEEWNVTIRSSEGKELWRTNGAGAPQNNIVWSLDRAGIEELAPHGSDGATVRIELAATTNDGERLEARRDVPVRRTFSSRRYSGEVVRDSLVERYSLIFFDFNTPRISQFNSEAIDLVRNRMRTSSSVAVTGLTDRIGDEEYNATLSGARAEETSSLIRERIVPERLTVRGAGEELIYNNDLPEGRLYNRTVIVEITTPIGDE